ncbi:MAG: hypothetical protein AAGD05_14065, partial [Bacteroidota bacterium]
TDFSKHSRKTNQKVAKKNISLYLGPNIKLIRKKWRYQQAGFAKLLASTKGRVGQYELRNNEPSIPFLLELEKVSGISSRVLYNRFLHEDEIPAQPVEPTLEIPKTVLQETKEPDANHARKSQYGNVGLDEICRTSFRRIRGTSQKCRSFRRRIKSDCRLYRNTCRQPLHSR